MAAGSFLDEIVTALVPSLSRSLAEQFNVFRVMHHGTHEKQLSNVFAWLLSADGTHALGDAFQRLFIEQVNQSLADTSRLPASSYQVVQEIDIGQNDDLGGDIADIVLTSPSARVVVENFESSDGHGHDYYAYLEYGAANGRQSVVVLLCARHQPALQSEGWEKAAVVTYPKLLQGLKTRIANDSAWHRDHPRQAFFINELVEHFTEGPRAVSDEDRIAFIKAMCDTGESARYGHRPHQTAAQEFADLLALHAQRQFEESRETLSEVKKALKRYAERTLTGQVNKSLPTGDVTGVVTRFVGQWEWCVELRRADSQPTVYLEYGPTAVVENGRVAQPVVGPDYTKVFVTRQATAPGDDGIDRIIQTDVGLDEVLAGLGDGDIRLRDGVLAVMSEG